jgi:hypothetical protein
MSREFIVRSTFFVGDRCGGTDDPHLAAAKRSQPRPSSTPLSTSCLFVDASRASVDAGVCVAVNGA